MSNLKELQDQLTGLINTQKEKEALKEKLEKQNKKKDKPTIAKLGKQIKEVKNKTIPTKRKAIETAKATASKKAGAKKKPPNKTDKTNNKGAVATTCKPHCNTKVPPKPLPGGKICITIDHLDTTPNGFTTENIVKQLLGLEALNYKKIVNGKKTKIHKKYIIKKNTVPVTVFVQAKGGFADAENPPSNELKGKVPRQKVHHLSVAQVTMLTSLKTLVNKKYKLKLGVHLLGKQDLIKDGKNGILIKDLDTEVQMQLDNIAYLKGILNGTMIASYHGANAASVPSANHHFVKKQFHLIRDTESASPSIPQLRKVNSRTTTQFFFHATELIQDPNKYEIYQILLEGIKSGKYIAKEYK